MIHIPCLNALAIVGNIVINDNYLVESKPPDSVKNAQILMMLTKSIGLRLEI
ncbi:hypothetical protein [Lysinibacillus sphaericus]|uniref:hypothetical protein n=1 Tax=Lysinibacillus sphaericus TaxID=1421 RepID=UPI003D7FCF20